MVYEIRIKEQLDPALVAWFGDFTIRHTPDGNTLLTGTLPDMAALYGVVARCRDLGLTLISIKPVGESKYNKEQTMNSIHVEASQIIDARPEEIYAVISDYHVGHPAILPKPYFTGLTVEQGGKGAGTIVLTEMIVWGQKYTYRQVVSEPEPGRVLLEKDANSEQFSTFTLDPLEGGTKTRVTITSEFPPMPGLMGILQKLTQPPVTRSIYRKELQNLADYVRSKNGVAN